MTEISRPWNGTVTGDAGPYTDEQWRTLYRAIVGYGAGRGNNGVFLMSGTEPNDGLKVEAQSPASASVNVLLGAALVQGLVYINSATESFVVAANASGNPRIDTIVLRADYALQTCRLALKQGTPAASPAAPSLTQSAGVLWEIPIADIAVANGFTTISNSNITQRQEWVNAPPGVFLDSLLNNSGAILNTGNVVVWDSTADRAVTTTTTRDFKRVAGVWQGKGAVAGRGRVLRSGIGYVLTDAAVTRGDILITSTTAGVATKLATNEAASNGIVGRALETTSGAGYALAFIYARIVNDFDVVIVQDQKANNTGGGTPSAAAWTTHTLNTEVVDTGNIATLASNQVTLPAGVYSVWWAHSWATNVGANRTRIRDVTNGVTLASSINGNNVGSVQGWGRFVLTGSAAIELQYYTATAQAGGLGAAANTGDVEIYASVEFHRHGETP